MTKYDEEVKADCAKWY